MWTMGGTTKKAGQFAGLGLIGESRRPIGHQGAALLDHRCSQIRPLRLASDRMCELDFGEVAIIPGIVGDPIAEGAAKPKSKGLSDVP
jgi:hypothetical protein